jgi:hypothetical protein
MGETPLTGIRWDGETEAHREVLVASLRRIAGLPALAFGGDRMLTLGAADALAAGSATAREILSDALGRAMLFVIEDHSGDERVNFAELDAGTVVTDDQRPYEPVVHWKVRIDFADFARVNAGPAVRAAFDPGFALLHELLHGLGKRDAVRVDEAGAVEDVLNRVREELALPIRERYFAERISTPPGLLAARLRFRSAVARGAARTEYLGFYFLQRESGSAACGSLSGMLRSR